MGTIANMDCFSDSYPDILFMDLILITGVVGFLATTTSFIRFLPQAIQTWKQRNDAHALSGLSLPTQWLTLVNSLLWIVYGFLLGEIWVSMPSLLNAPMALFVIVLIIHSRNKIRNIKNQYSSKRYQLGVDYAEGKITKNEYDAELAVLDYEPK